MSTESEKSMNFTPCQESEVVNESLNIFCPINIIILLIMYCEL